MTRWNMLPSYPNPFCKHGNTYHQYPDNTHNTLHLFSRQCYEILHSLWHGLSKQANFNPPHWLTIILNVKEYLEKEQRICTTVEVTLRCSLKPRSLLNF